MRKSVNRKLSTVWVVASKCLVASIIAAIYLFIGAKHDAFAAASASDIPTYDPKEWHVSKTITDDLRKQIAGNALTECADLMAGDIYGDPNNMDTLVPTQFVHLNKSWEDTGGHLIDSPYKGSFNVPIPGSADAERIECSVVGNKSLSNIIGQKDYIPQVIIDSVSDKAQCYSAEKDDACKNQDTNNIEVLADLSDADPDLSLKQALQSGRYKNVTVRLGYLSELIKSMPGRTTFPGGAGLYIKEYTILSTACGKIKLNGKGAGDFNVPVWDESQGKYVLAKNGYIEYSDGADKKVWVNSKNQNTCKQVAYSMDGHAQAYVDAMNECQADESCEGRTANPGGESSTMPEVEGSDSDSVDEEDPCQAGLLGFGWLFCPGANLLDSFLNGFLNEIDDQLNWTFLVDHSSEIKSRWQQFVNIANIIFAIAFLIMIYSMATSTGLSNYDVKKILPRLIVIAIAVNTSFYICGALVDASNIAGEGLYAVMSGGISKWAPSMGMDGLLGVTTNVVLIVGCIFIFGIAAIVALAIILVCVTARQIALIVLICISPVAFACYLLPNTTKWFQKWLDYFTKLLLVYPMYTAVWGAAKWIGSMPADAISIGPFAFITQAICMIAPALAIIPLFKMSGGIMGAVAARAAGSGLANRGRAAQTWMRGKGAGVAKNNFATRGITKRVSNAAGKFAVKHIGDEHKGIRGGLNRWAGRKALGVANAAGTHAQSIDAELQSLDSSAMNAAQTKIAGYSDEQLMNAITDSSTDQYTARAAMEKLGENMDEGQVREMLTSVAKKTNSMGPGHEREAQALRDAAYKAAVASKSALVSNKSLQSFRNGNWGKSNGKSVEAEYTSGVIDYASRLSADSLSGLSANKQKYIRETLKDTSSNGVSGADDAIKSFRNASETAANDPKLLSKMGASAQKALSENQDLRTSSETTAAQNLGLNSARSALKTAQSAYYQADQSGDATAIAKAQSLINDAERNIDGIGNKILSDPQAMGNYNNLYKADKQWMDDQTLHIFRKNNP